jgi:hypothetical protein
VPQQSITRRSDSRTSATRAFVLAVALVLSLAVASAEATQPYTGRGAIGPVQLFQGQCFFYPYWSRLDAHSAAPRIWAPNLRRGGGNDAAYARWRLWLVDSAGRTLGSPTYSPYAYVTDNGFASPGGAQGFTGVADGARLDVYVEWRTRSNQRIGWAVYHVPSYSMTTGGVGPTGPLSACARVFPNQQGIPPRPYPGLPSRPYPGLPPQ